MSEEYSHLPPHERAKKFRELADDARGEAERVSDRRVKESYVLIAKRWEEMAAEIEKRLSRGDKWEVD